MKISLVSCSLFFVFYGRIVAGESPSTNSVVISPPFIELLAEEARTNHPALRAADIRADAAGWNAVAVRTWENPTVKFGVMGADRVKRADDGDLIYGVEQKLPLFGKPEAARALAQSEAITQRREAAFRALQLRRDLTAALLKEALSERLVSLGGDDLAVLETLATTAEDKYRNGLATQAEVLQAQNERARRANRLRSEESLLQAERASLNRLLNRPIDSAWPPLLLPGVASNLPPLKLLIEHAAQMAPQLDVTRASLRQAESSVAVARRQRWPDVSVGVEGRQFADTGEFREGVVTLGLSIPWGNRGRYAAELKRESQKAEAARLDLADMQLVMREEITRHVILIDNARREAELYRSEIVPRSDQAATVARGNWTNGRGTLRDALDARRLLIE
ncbi:MAG TPA: TolC family protein, partial [Verrucomicrobiae bacterium]